MISSRNLIYTNILDLTQHQNGQHAIPLTNLVNYNCTDEIVTSLMEFLKYNNFEISDITIEQPLI